MQHTESSIKIYYTKDYSLFNNINGNRPLNFPKMDRIISDIESGIDLLRYCPILVIERNNKLEIVDGQHRFHIAKEIGSKVWYIIAEELSLYDIARMNSNTEKWNAKDFINCYCELGNQDYHILKDFIQKYPLPVTTAISLLSEAKLRTTSRSCKNDFEHGIFKVSHNKYAEDLLQIASKFTFLKKYTRPFLIAFEKVYLSKKIDIEELIEKANKNQDFLEHLETDKQYLSALENVFNKGKQHRIVIY